MTFVLLISFPLLCLSQSTSSQQWPCAGWRPALRRLCTTTSWQWRPQIFSPSSSSSSSASCWRRRFFTGTSPLSCCAPSASPSSQPTTLPYGPPYRSPWTATWRCATPSSTGRSATRHEPGRLSGWSWRHRSHRACLSSGGRTCGGAAIRPQRWTPSSYGRTWLSSTSCRAASS